MVKKGKKKGGFFRILGKILWFILMIPYYLVKWIIKGIKLIVKGLERIFLAFKATKQQIKRKAIKSNYEEFKIIKEIDGDYKEWFTKTAESDSKIGIILGSRGSGKTAFGIKFIENIHSRFNKKCFAIGFKKEELPIWINVVEEISKIENNSVVLIDEGGVLFNSRSSMSSANKLLSSLMLIARHKNISILFISQNSSNLEVNILRQADFLVLKPSSLLQKDFERKIIKKIYEKTANDFERYKKIKGLTHIYSNDFQGFVSNSLPSFWKESISKSFK